MDRARRRRLGIVATAAVVIAAYVFFATAGTFDFRHVHVEDNYRALASAFLHGQLHLQERPDPRLAALDNPYDLSQRQSIPYRWDHSYYNGRYYLYFNPLPALTVYAPWRVLTGRFPSPALAIVLLAAVAWLFQAKALLVAAPRLDHSRWRVGLLLLLGLGNLVPYTVLRPDMYELAVMAGYACSSAFLWSAAHIWFRGPSATAAARAGLSGAASIASRPSLAPLILVLGGIAAVIWRRGAGQRLRLVSCLVVGLVLVGSASAWYNAARFGSILELGTSFMLGSADHRVQRVCSPLTTTGWARAVNGTVQYLASLPLLDGGFPFIRLRPGVPLPADFAELHLPLEDVAGLLLLFPFLLAGLAALPWAARDPEHRRMAMFAALMASCAAAIALTVGTCWYVIARYELDFWPPLALASALGLGWLATVATRHWQRALLVTAVGLGVLVGLLLGMSGNGDLLRA